MLLVSADSVVDLARAALTFFDVVVVLDLLLCVFLVTCADLIAEGSVGFALVEVAVPCSDASLKSLDPAPLFRRAFLRGGPVESSTEALVLDVSDVCVSILLVQSAESAVIIGELEGLPTILSTSPSPLIMAPCRGGLVVLVVEAAGAETFSCSKLVEAAGVETFSCSKLILK
ncbi:hypothetical protein PF003_g31613 [Phytophthora fragariae]|nr:hypothetical protein PF003_g31613 [Phytophthora fragariae]